MFLELLVVAVMPASVPILDDARAIDQIGLRDALLQVLPLVNRRTVEQHRVGYPLLADELRDIFLRFVVRVHGDDLETLVGEFLVERHEVRNLRTAGPSPCRPEVQQDDAALMLGHGDLLVIHA